MPLTESQQQKLQKWLSTLPRPGCPVCGGEDLRAEFIIGVSDYAAELGEVAHAQLIVPVTCSGCGHVMLIDAVVAGVVGP